MKKFVFFMIVMLMFLSVVSIAFADSTYPNYQWRYRMQIQQQGQTNSSLTADGIVGGRTWEALQDYLSKTRRDSNGFDYYKVSSTEYFAHGTDGTWWLLTDSGTFSKIR